MILVTSVTFGNQRLEVRHNPMIITIEKLTRLWTSSVQLVDELKNTYFIFRN
jgi:hypothetical protein